MYPLCFQSLGFDQRGIILLDNLFPLLEPVFVLPFCVNSLCVFIYLTSLKLEFFQRTLYCSGLDDRPATAEKEGA